MIHLSHTPRPLPADLLATPGAFAWWYADVVTPAGDGAVLIWSYGLPFLPGSASAARAGRPQVPRARPCVNLVLYRGGQPVLYLLHEYTADEADGRVAGEQRMGGCTFRSVAGERGVELQAALDLPIPGTAERVTGVVRVGPHPSRLGSPPSPTSGRGEVGIGSGVGGEVSTGRDAHVWTPLIVPGVGAVDVQVGGRDWMSVRGRGYHDRNFGRVPLGGLGIGWWAWGRVPFADREAVYYLLWPADGGAPTVLGLEMHGSGRVREVAPEVAMEGGMRGVAGMRSPRRIRLSVDGRPWLEVRHTRIADDGPFYLRLLSQGTAADGETAVGWGEVCRPDRIDLALHRPLVRMRVHRSAGGSSVWLPLFSGPREGRIRRLVRGMLGHGGGAG